MAHFFVDSSVLVKRHIGEVGTAWFQTLADPSSGNTIIISQISVAEVCSALNRRVREASLDRTGYIRVIADFDALCVSEYQAIELTALIIGDTRRLLEQYPLRANDALQLVSAINANSALIAAGLAALTFLSADNRLLSAAEIEGLATGNPNVHP